MIITLTNDEVRIALARAIEEKTSHTLGEVNSDECWFTVMVDGAEIDAIESVQFSAEL